MSSIDEVKARVDIVDFISRYTPLKRAGSTYKGLCPFHNERTPSFIVFPNSGTWHCFGSCGVGGDALSFLMRKENLEFREALQLLAREVGVTLEETQQNAQHGQREALYKINEVATAYFQEVLAHHPSAKGAREYLARRGIDQTTSERFQLGFALDSWNGLRDFLTARNFTLDQQLQAGLLKRNEEKESLYDAFRGRVMIPIRERQGKVIGFGGRVLDDSQPKYLNTSETLLFHKSHVVYGIDLAHQAIRTLNQVVIVEGYMDVIAAHQHGFANVVACMGTALTAEQLRQLQRYTDHFILALDADSAGQAATIRGLNQARQSLGRVQKPTFLAGGGLQMTERLSATLSILSMPEGLDPDDVVRKNPTLWQELVKAAKPLVDFYFDIVRKQHDLSSAVGKGQAVAELAPLIAELEDEIERQHYTQRLSRLVQMDEVLIASRVQATMRTRRVSGLAERSRQSEGEEAEEREEGSTKPKTHGQATHGQTTHGQASNRQSFNRPGTYQGQPEKQPEARGMPPAREDHLLTNLLRTPQLLIWLANATTTLEIGTIQPGDFSKVENQEILRALRHYLNGDETWDLELFQEILPTELHGHLAALVSYGTQLPPGSIVDLQHDTVKALISIRLQRLKAENMNIKYLLDDAQHEHDRDAIQQFSQTNNQIRRQLFHLQQVNVNLSKIIKPGFDARV